MCGESRTHGVKEGKRTPDRQWLRKILTYSYFLGLRTLTVIQNAVANVKHNRGIVIDMDKMEMNDSAVFASLGTGRTEGVFQLESSGMKNFMKELKPENLEDVIAGISLYRPGPMDCAKRFGGEPPTCRRERIRLRRTDLSTNQMRG